MPAVHDIDKSPTTYLILDYKINEINIIRVNI